MRLIINLESGDRFLYFLDRKQIADHESLIKSLQAILREDFPKKYVLFSSCKQTDPEPIRMIKNLKDINTDYQHIYMYST